MVPNVTPVLSPDLHHMIIDFLVNSGAVSIPRTGTRDWLSESGAPSSKLTTVD